MASKPKSNNLGFPIFGLCFYKDWVLISGGGGGKKFAVLNKILIFKSQTMQLVRDENTGDDLLTSIHHLPTSDLLLGSLGKDIVVYKISNNLEIRILARTLCEKEKPLKIVNPYEGEKKLITAGEEGFIGLWKLENNGSAIRTLQINAGFEVFSCDCAQTFVCAALKNKSCGIFSSETGEKLKTLQFGQDPNSLLLIRSCVFANSELITLGTAQKSGYLTRWSLTENFCPIDSLKVSETTSPFLKLSRSKTLAAIGKSDGGVVVVDLKRFRIGFSKQEFEMPVTCCDFNMKESLIMVGSADYCYEQIKLGGFGVYWMVVGVFVGVLSVYLALG